MPTEHDADAAPEVSLHVADLAAVVYSAGKVFDGLNTGRLDTESFLRDGDTSHITSRSDLALLEDLRDAAEFVLDFATSPDAVLNAEVVCEINRRMTRSASIQPGELRRADQGIGVDTMLGRHEPPAPEGLDGLEAILSDAVVEGIEAARKVVEPAPGTAPRFLVEMMRETALAIFVHLAKAQPFMDGNKRTAIFAANSWLLSAWAGHEVPQLLTVPVDEPAPGDATKDVSGTFNHLLARAYKEDDHQPVKALLRERGFLTPSLESKAQWTYAHFEALLEQLHQAEAGPAGSDSPEAQSLFEDLRRMMFEEGEEQSMLLAEWVGNGFAAPKAPAEDKHSGED